MDTVSLQGQKTFKEMKGSLDRLPKTKLWAQMAGKFLCHDTCLVGWSKLHI